MNAILKALWCNVMQTREDDLHHALKSNSLFSDLSPKDLRIVTDIVHIRNYHKGERIFHQKDMATGMYIILSGKVAITLD